MNLFFTPIAEASAQTLMNSINKVIINPLIILLFSLAVVYFILGLVRYLLSPDNEDVRKTSKSHMFWGLVGIFIMLSVYGILNIIVNTLS